MVNIYVTGTLSVSIVNVIQSQSPGSHFRIHILPLDSPGPKVIVTNSLSQFKY
jgi:hypothetical protein